MPEFFYIKIRAFCLLGILLYAQLRYDCSCIKDEEVKVITLPLEIDSSSFLRPTATFCNFLTERFYLDLTKERNLAYIVTHL